MGLGSYSQKAKNGLYTGFYSINIVSVHFSLNSVFKLVVAETSLPVFRLAGLTNTWTVSPLTCDFFRGPATYLRTYIQLDSNFVTLTLSSTTLFDNSLRQLSIPIFILNLNLYVYVYAAIFYSDYPLSNVLYCNVAKPKKYISQLQVF